MLPGASAPNAMAYGTGELKVRDIIATGIVMNILSVLAIVIATFTLISWAFSIEPGVMPSWAKQ